MRKITTLFLLILIGIIGLITYGQPIENTILPDSGYYYGIVQDSFMNKSIFMSFLSNEGDEQVYIVPYVIDRKLTVADTSFMHEDFIKSLKQENDSIDGNVYVDLGWSIPGFDNHTYYTVDGNFITLSLNIASIDKPVLDVFEFKGKIESNGKIIKAVVSSTDSIFNLSTIILTYKNIKK